MGRCLLRFEYHISFEATINSKDTPRIVGDISRTGCIYQNGNGGGLQRVAAKQNQSSCRVYNGLIVDRPEKVLLIKSGSYSLYITRADVATIPATFIAVNRAILWATPSLTAVTVVDRHYGDSCRR